MNLSDITRPVKIISEFDTANRRKMKRHEFLVINAQLKSNTIDINQGRPVMPDKIFMFSEIIIGQQVLRNKGGSGTDKTHKASLCVPISDFPLPVLCTNRLKQNERILQTAS